MPGIHALLSASGAKRWMNCTPSALLETQFPDKDTAYSKEGTLAHEAAAWWLNLNLNDTSTTISEEANTEEIFHGISPYLDFVHDAWTEAKGTCPDAVLLVEQRVDFSELVPEGFGTADAVLIYGDTIHIMDLKYGKGVPVSAYCNPQLRLYAFGAVMLVRDLYEIKNVKMSIIQPRLDADSTDEMSVEELIRWGLEEVHPRAQKAFRGEGELTPGEWCRFCKAGALCSKRKEENLQLARLDFRKAELLSSEELGKVLSAATALRNWVEDVEKWCLEEALKGNTIEGYKLVEGKSKRQYTNEDAVVDALKAAGYEEAAFMEKKVLGITAMEKALGKKTFTKVLGNCVYKPAGKPTLALISDKRPALNSAVEDFKDVVDEI